MMIVSDSFKELLKEITQVYNGVYHDYAEYTLKFIENDEGQYAKIAVGYMEELGKVDLIYLDSKQEEFKKQLKDFQETNKDYLELQIRASKEINKINDIIFPDTRYDHLGTPYNFLTLLTEIRRLKVQDLTIQIPSKNEELDGLINSAKQKLSRAEIYTLEKLIKKNYKICHNNDNSDLKKLDELKEILSEKLTEEELKTLLDKQKEVADLEECLENLTQVQHTELAYNTSDSL
ncbi:3177_t:CDS:1 [Acaulospora colombiana]|uniref:3177_t:CDS:1 n=1 Tax=Acaulospora colombiana TaxID=27376 RepID=A0ACA9PA78_9GLOM|nr:3177_t:CDS:1 [Acaulospora colombiana]